MKNIAAIALLLFLILGSAQTSLAVIEAVQFEDTTSEQRYRDLIAELRCLVCQNQNLADSDADLAKDLRRKTAEMIKAGKSDREIVDYMRTRYGDFVLYRPPFNRATALLWVGPFVLLLLAGFIVLRMIRKNGNKQPGGTAQGGDEATLNKVRSLLETPDRGDTAAADLPEDKS